MAEVLAGKEVVIGKAGKPIAKLVPIEHDASERICIIFSLYCDPWHLIVYSDGIIEYPLIFRISLSHNREVHR